MLTNTATIGYRRLWPSAALALLALATILIPARAQAQEQRELGILLDGRLAEVATDEREMAELGEALPDKLKAFRSALGGYRARYDRLVAMESLLGRNPWEMSSLLDLFVALRGDLQKSTAALEQRAQELGELDSRSAQQASELRGLASQAAEPELKTAALRAVRRAAATSSRAKLYASRTAMAMRQSESLSGSLAARIEAQQARLGPAWKRYYLEPERPYLSVAGLTAQWTRTKAWLGGLPRYGSTTATSSAGWRALLLNAGVFGLLVLGAGLVGIRRMRRRWPGLDALPLRSSWCWLALAIGLMVAGGLAPQIRQDRVEIAAALMLGYGLVGIGWSLRRAAADGQPSARHNPLRPLWLLLAVGTVLQVTGAPAGLLTVVLCVLVALLAPLVRTQIHKRPPSFEHNALHATAWILVGLAAGAVLGWAQLAMLLSAGWFVALLAIQMSLALQRLLSAWGKHAASGEVPALARALVLGLGYPTVWLLAAATIPLWLSRRIGRDDLLWSLLHKDLGWGTVSSSLLRLVIVVVGFFLVRVALSFIRSAIERLYPTEGEAEQGAVDSLCTVSTYLAWVLYGFGALLVLGVSFTSVAVITGGLSVGIGFGLQNIVNNFVSGVLLLVGGSIQRGDAIRIGEVYGVVQRVTIRNTMVRTFDNSTVFVPNSELVSNRLTNWTHRDRSIRRDVKVGVAYGSDTELVRQLLLDVAAAHPRVLDEPAPLVLFASFGDSSLDFTLRVWIDDFDSGLSTQSELRDQIDRAFRQHGVEIAFPQRDLHLRSADGLDGSLDRAPGPKPARS